MILRFFYILLLFNSAVMFSLAHAAGCNSQSDLKGINLPSGGFANSRLPGNYYIDYKYPSQDEIKLYIDAGFNSFRVAFLWERIQPELYQELDNKEFLRLDAVVKYIAAQNKCVILDLHNYGIYYGNLVGSREVPKDALTDLWVRLARRYSENNNVIFGLMNEPYKHDAKTWADIVQHVLLGIRNSGARNLVLIPGTRWSASFAWLRKDGLLSNAEALSAIHDPADNSAYEMHLYFDKDSSGTSPECVNSNIGVARIAEVAEWLKGQQRRALIGEFGSSRQNTCVEALDRFLFELTDRSDQFLGWTYWAGSKMFGNYMFNIYPPDSKIYPQMKILWKYIQ